MTEAEEKQYNEIAPVLVLAARKNFWAFCCYMDWEFFRIRRRFFKDVAVVLQSVVDSYADGLALKVGLSFPPRAGKSYLVSLFAAYWLGRCPALSVMRNSCTSTLYDKFSYDTRAIVRSMKFKEVFPGIELSKDKQNLGGWNLSTSKQVGYFGSGVGGSIIGFGANIAISDDLYKGMSDAMSDAVQASTKMWKQSEHNSRMERNCPEIFVGTRWTRDDVIGDAIDSGELTYYMKVPALIDGVTFCDDVKTTDEYDKIRESLKVGDHDGLVWLAEYMQEPTEAEGVLLPIDRLKFADLTGLTYSYIFGVGDPADHGGDKYACPFIGVRTESEQRNGHTVNHVRCYVLGALCNNDGIKVNTNMIFDRYKKYAVEHVYIEKNGLGLASVIELTNILGQAIKPFTSKEDKDVRILSNFEFIEEHFVFDKSYKQDRQYLQFVSDLTTFSKAGKNLHKKDAIDVLSTAANIVKIKYRSVIYG